MAKKLTFTKAVILAVSRKAERGTVVISCAASKTVMNEMGWSEPADWQKSCVVADGALAATSVEFTPTHKDSEKHAFDLSTTAVRDFEFVRTQVNKGKSAQKSKTYRLELHCKVHFDDPEGAGKVERSWSSVRDWSMKVTYEPAAEQGALPGTADDQGELDEVEE